MGPGRPIPLLPCRPRAPVGPAQGAAGHPCTVPTFALICCSIPGHAVTRERGLDRNVTSRRHPAVRTPRLACVPLALPCPSPPLGDGAAALSSWKQHSARLHNHLRWCTRAATTRPRRLGGPPGKHAGSEAGQGLSGAFLRAAKEERRLRQNQIWGEAQHFGEKAV